MSVNKVLLLGFVGQEPVIRSAQDGKKIASFSLATSEKWQDKTGEQREKTFWHKVVIFNDGLAGVVERYVKKGSKLFIEGKLQTREWEDKEGVKKYITEVVLQGFNNKLEMLDGKGDIDTSNEAPMSREPSGIEDDIPF